MAKLNQITKDNHEHEGGEEDSRAVERINMKRASASEKKEREIIIPKHLEGAIVIPNKKFPNRKFSGNPFANLKSGGDGNNSTGSDGNKLLIEPQPSAANGLENRVNNNQQQPTADSMPTAATTKSTTITGPSRAPVATNAKNSNPFAAVELKSGSTGAPFLFGAVPKTEQIPFSFGQSSSQQQKSTSSSRASNSNPFAAVELKSGSTDAPFLFGAAPKKQSPFSIGQSSSQHQIKDINENFFKMIQDHVKDGNILSDLSPLMEQYIHMAENFHSDEEDDGGDGDNEDENGNNSASGSAAFSGGT